MIFLNSDINRFNCVNHNKKHEKKPQQNDRVFRRFEISVSSFNLLCLWLNVLLTINWNASETSVGHFADISKYNNISLAMHHDEIISSLTWKQNKKIKLGTEKNMINTEWIIRKDKFEIVIFIWNK